MADLVSEVIADVAIEQINNYIELLTKATGKVAALAAVSKTITIEFKGIANLQALNDLLELAGDNTDEMKRAAASLAAVTTQLNTATAQYNITTKENAERLAQQKLELGYVQEQLKILNKDIVAGKGNIDANNASLTDWTRRQQELKVEIGATTTSLKAQIKESVAATGSMDAMGQTLGILRENYRKLSAEQRASPMGTEMVANIKLLDTELKNLDTTIGNNQRKVGEYERGIGKAGDSVGRFGAVIDRLGLRLLANLTIFALIIELIKEVGDSYKEYSDRINYQQVAMEAVAKKSSDTFSKEAAAIEAMRDRFEAATSTMSDKQEVVDELNRKYENQIGKINGIADAEKFFVERSGDFIKALDLRAQAEASLSVISDQYKKQLEATANPETTLSTFNKVGAAAAALGTTLSGLFGRSGGKGTLSENFDWEKLTRGAGKADRTIQDTSTTIDYLLKQYVKLQNQAKALDDKNGFNTDVAGKKGAKGKADNTAQSQSDYANSVYQLEKQRVEADRDNQKEISDNVKNDLQIRLSAYQQYMADILTLAALERDKEIAIHAAKLADIQSKEKAATGTQLSALKVEADAQGNYIQAAIEKYATTENKTLLDAKKGTMAIIRSSNADWIKENEDTFAQQKLDEITGYLAEENLLKAAFDIKLITRKQYDKDIKDLQQKQQISFLEAEIEFDKRILANDQITTEERIKYQSKLLNDQKSLGKAQSGNLGDKPKLGNITDPIAKLFSPEGYDNEEQYLKEFYARTVDIAKAASDAIIETKNRQFEAENLLLNQQETALRISNQQEQDEINATAKNSVDRQNQLSQLAAQTAAQENVIEQEKRKVAQEQARFQKAASIAGIIESTAVAIAGALKYGPAAPPIIALIAAAGAIQLATAAAAPIPQYRFGTQNHPGGSFIAGDGGQRELIAPPGKTPYWSNAISTLYNEGSGTKVIPQDKLKSLDVMGGYSAGNITRLEQQQARQDNLHALGKMFDASLREHGENLSYVIAANKTRIPQPESMKDAVKELRRTQGL